MNAAAASPTPASPSFVPIVLTVSKCGHVPAFKNKKRAILDRATGKMRTLTDKDSAQWMKTVAASFESQLRSWLQTDESVIQTVRLQPSSIATCLPLDDCLDWIGTLCINWRTVSKGEEGALVEITRTK